MIERMANDPTDIRQVETMKEFEGKRILVTGGTGSLGQTLVSRSCRAKWARPRISRSFRATKQSSITCGSSFCIRDVATDDVIYQNSRICLIFGSAMFATTPRSRRDARCRCCF